MTRKPRHYWTDFENVRQELLQFIQTSGQTGIMPSIQQLETAGRTDLLRAMKLHGGFPVVAERCGLQYVGPKPDGYWDDFDNLAHELRLFMESQGLVDQLPSHQVLRRAGRSDLIYALHKQGTPQAVAEQLGLQGPPPQVAHGYWKDFRHLKHDLLAFITESGNPGQMPTDHELRQAQRSDLAKAIGQHGGMAAVASQLGLWRPTAAKASGYWDDFDNLARELRLFISVHHYGDRIPTQRELERAKRADLSNAIVKHGGVIRVANRLGLKPTRQIAPRRWKHFSKLKHELNKFIQQQGVVGVLPTPGQLRNAQRRDLVYAIRQFGGFEAVAEKMQLVYQPARKQSARDAALPPQQPKITK